MIPLRTLLLLYLLFGCLYSCQKVELPVEDETGTTDKEPDISYDDEYPGYEDSSYYMSVAAAQELFAEEGDEKPLCIVRGYIVGYAKGNSIRNAVFAADSAVATNLLLADYVLETDYTKCLPVELKKGSDCRTLLNLQEHPDLLHAKIVVLGSLEKYFSVAGIKDVEDAEILAYPDELETPDSIPDKEPEPVPNPQPDEETPDEDPEEIPEPDPTPEHDDSVLIDDRPVVIPGGRTISHHPIP